MLRKNGYLLQGEITGNLIVVCSHHFSEIEILGTRDFSDSIRYFEKVNVGSLFPYFFVVFLDLPSDFKTHSSSGFPWSPIGGKNIYDFSKTRFQHKFK